MPVKCRAEGGIDCHLPECSDTHCWELEEMANIVQTLPIQPQPATLITSTRDAMRNDWRKVSVTLGSVIGKSCAPAVAAPGSELRNGPHVINGKLIYQDGNTQFSCTCIVGECAERVVALFSEAIEQRGTLLGAGITNGDFRYSPLGEQLVAMEKRALSAEAKLVEHGRNWLPLHKAIICMARNWVRTRFRTKG